MHRVAEPAPFLVEESRAREHIQRHFSWDTVTEQTEALYEEMLRGR